MATHEVQLSRFILGGIATFLSYPEARGRAYHGFLSAHAEIATVFSLESAAEDV